MLSRVKRAQCSNKAQDAYYVAPIVLIQHFLPKKFELESRMGKIEVRFLHTVTSNDHVLLN